MWGVRCVVVGDVKCVIVRCDVRCVVVRCDVRCVMRHCVILQERGAKIVESVKKYMLEYLADQSRKYSEPYFTVSEVGISLGHRSERHLYHIHFSSLGQFNRNVHFLSFFSF